MIGKKIKDYLEQNNIKQSDIAEVVGINNYQVSDYFGKDISIDCVTYYKICKALGVPLDTFLKETDDIKTEK